MSDTVNPIPDGYHSITPYLIIDGAGDAIEFYKKVFGATEIMRMPWGAEGKLGHAEIQIGNSRIMMADEHPEMGAKGPGGFGGSPVMIHVYLEEVDKVAERAVAAGAEIVRPLQDQFYGDRSGMFKDPFGHLWAIASHVEDVAPEELARRAAEAGKGECEGG
jgi:PhnB protein